MVRAFISASSSAALAAQLHGADHHDDEHDETGGQELDHRVRKMSTHRCLPEMCRTSQYDRAAGAVTGGSGTSGPGRGLSVGYGGPR